MKTYNNRIIRRPKAASKVLITALALVVFLASTITPAPSRTYAQGPEPTPTPPPRVIEGADGTKWEVSYYAIDASDPIAAASVKDPPPPVVDFKIPVFQPREPVGRIQPFAWPQANSWVFFEKGTARWTDPDFRDAGDERDRQYWYGGEFLNHPTHGWVVKCRPLGDIYWYWLPASKALPDDGCESNQSPSGACYLGEVNLDSPSLTYQGRLVREQGVDEDYYAFWLGEGVMAQITVNSPHYGVRRAAYRFINGSWELLADDQIRDGVKVATIGPAWIVARIYPEGTPPPPQDYDLVVQRISDENFEAALASIRLYSRTPIQGMEVVSADNDAPPVPADDLSYKCFLPLLMKGEEIPPVCLLDPVVGLKIIQALGVLASAGEREGFAWIWERELEGSEHYYQDVTVLESQNFEISYPPKPGEIPKITVFGISSFVSLIDYPERAKAVEAALWLLRIFIQGIPGFGVGVHWPWSGPLFDYTGSRFHLPSTCGCTTGYGTGVIGITIRLDAVPIQVNRYGDVLIKIRRVDEFGIPLGEYHPACEACLTGYDWVMVEHLGKLAAVATAYAAAKAAADIFHPGWEDQTIGLSPDPVAITWLPGGLKYGVLTLWILALAEPGPIGETILGLMATGSLASNFAPPLPQSIGGDETKGIFPQGSCFSADLLGYGRDPGFPPEGTGIGGAQEH